MEPNESHLLQNVVIKLSNSTKYLTPPKSGCKIIPQDNIGSVEEEPELEKNKMDEAEVYEALATTMVVSPAKARSPHSVRLVHAQSAKCPNA